MLEFLYSTMYNATEDNHNDWYGTVYGKPGMAEHLEHLKPEINCLI